MERRRESKIGAVVLAGLALAATALAERMLPKVLYHDHPVRDTGTAVILVSIVIGMWMIALMAAVSQQRVQRVLEKSARLVVMSGLAAAIVLPLAYAVLGRRFCLLDGLMVAVYTLTLVLSARIASRWRPDPTLQVRIQRFRDRAPRPPEE